MNPHTLPETNIAREIWWLDDEMSFYTGSLFGEHAIFFGKLYIPQDPWDWYIYLHLPLILRLMVSKTSWWLSHPIEKISKLIKLSPASGENKRRYLKSPPQGNQCETHLLNCCRRLSSPYILNDFFVWAVSTNPSLTAPTTATTGAWCSLISLGTTGVQGAPFWRKTSNMDTANGRHIYI